ncbi:hypothetical protein K488DRAFT_83338 [Vararia minispora EC-137]|uniref:Uncharacterized protein n=1 Tax=Vararia minispora EC-137 TaxID=1314806 RepID=A0ACB8QTX0_9AGAM|nr:hypothetical protein K488DRAFT_83338 [Vararia minispora EC-137]
MSVGDWARRVPDMEEARSTMTEGGRDRVRARDARSRRYPLPLPSRLPLLRGAFSRAQRFGFAQSGSERAGSGQGGGGAGFLDGIRRARHVGQPGGSCTSAVLSSHCLLPSNALSATRDMPTSVVYPPRGRSRTVSPVAIAREASQERLAIQARLAAMPSDPEKHALASFTTHRRTDPSPSLTPGPRTPPDNHVLPSPVASSKAKILQPVAARALVVHVENPDTAHAPLNPYCAAPQSHIRPFPPAHAHTYSSPPSRLPTTPAKRPSPARAIISTKPAPSAAPGPSSSVSRSQTSRRLAIAESAFSDARSRSRRERIAALTARGIAEEAALERERLAREAAERDARRTSVCKTPNHPRQALAYTSRQQTLPHMRATQPPLLAPIVPYNPIRRALSDRGSAASEIEFTYAFPVPAAKLGQWNARAQKGSPRTRRALQELLEPAPNPRAVPFEDVLLAMRGALFAEPDEDARSPLPSWAGHRRRSRDVLTEDARRKHYDALMAPPGPPPKKTRRADDDRVPQDRDCAACSAAWQRSLASLSPPSTPALSPTSSAGSSPRSAHSVLATPRSWLPLSLFGREPPVPPTPKTPPLPKEEPEELRHSCGRPQAQCFVAVDVDDSPLGQPSSLPAPLSASPSTPLPAPAAQQQQQQQKKKSLLAPVSRLLASAVHMHEAYVQATLMSVALSADASASRLVPSPAAFHPHGVCAADVRASGLGAPLSAAEPYLLRALDDMRLLLPPHQSSYTHDLTLDTRPPTYPFFLPSYAPGPRCRPIAHPAHLRASALLNARRARECGTSMGLLPERMLGVACDVHGAGGRAGSALRKGWRVVWEDDE